MKNILSWLLLTSALSAQPLSLVNATLEGRKVHVTLQGSTIVGLSEQAPAASSGQVNLEGLYLYPGLVESDSLLGLLEIESVRGGNDHREVGSNNAELEPGLAFNPDSELLPVARSAGILTAALQTPHSSLSGAVSVMSLWGWTPADMQLRSSPGQVVNWPRLANQDRKKAEPEYRRKVEEISDLFWEAQAWSQLPPASRPVRPDLDALVRAEKLFIHAQSEYQIEDALTLCRRLKRKWVLVGGAEALKQAAALRQDGVDVIYTEVYRLPDYDWQSPSHFYAQPALLAKAGLRVALAGPSSRDNARWLTEMAAACWAHGWTRQQAEASITQTPCEILGLAEQGKIAVGQRATLIACNGPLLDGRSQVVRAWVAGREISLDDRQKRLYQRYRDRPRLTPTGPGAHNRDMIPDRPPVARHSPPPRPLKSTPEGPPAWGQSLTGDIRYHEIDERQVWVYLPPSYAHSPERKYPVLYALDGQNVFERGTAYMGQEWQMDEAAEKSMRAGQMQEAIIVAVSSGPERLHEYSPVADPKHGGGGAEDFAQYLKGRVMPEVQSSYRVETGPKSTGVLGSSMGGLMSLYLGLAHSNTFGLIGPMSPSLWWAEQHMIKAWKENPPETAPHRIWLDMGTREGSSDSNQDGVLDSLENTRALRDVLQAQGQTLTYREYPGAGHNEAAWRARIGEVMQGLLPPSES